MKFEITGTVTYRFTAEVEAGDMDEAMDVALSKSFETFETVELEDPHESWELGEIVDAEETWS
jgi:hypothetical protein